MNEAGEEYQGEWSTVVLEENTDPVAEEATSAESAAEVCAHEDEKGDDNGEVERTSIAETSKDLDPLLQVDEGDVEAKDVAGEACDPAKPVAGVGDGEDPVKNKRPATRRSGKIRGDSESGLNLHANPCHETYVVDTGRLHNVVHGTARLSVPHHCSYFKQ